MTELTNQSNSTQDTEERLLIRELVAALDSARPYIANLISLGEMHPRYPVEEILQRHKVLLEHIDALKAKAQQ